jgi:DNA-binding GntR family transcriptional regulator
MLVSSELGIGTALTEQRLAQQLGVSRTPIREALSRLSAEGLVETRPNGTKVVADLWPKVCDVFAIRVKLEPWAAALASQRMTAQDIESLRQLQDRMEVIVDDPSGIAELSELNQQFHWTVVTFCGNTPLIETLDRLRPYSVVPKIVEQYAPAVRHEAILEHRLIIDGLWRRDATETEELVRTHLDRGFDTLKNAVATAQVP